MKYRRIHTDLINKFRSDVPEYPHGLGVHSAANTISSGIATPIVIQLLMNSTLNDLTTICSWSMFNQYWILQGFAAAAAAATTSDSFMDTIDFALTTIDHCWGNMVETGRGCFHELSSPDWTAFRRDGDRLPTMPSLCHPWSSGATPWLSREIVGIQPIQPGYKSFIVAPYISESFPTISGTVPTPFGPITVNSTWTNVSTTTISIQINVRVPSTLRAENLLQQYPNYVGFPKTTTATMSEDRSRCHVISVSCDDGDGFDGASIVWMSGRRNNPRPPLKLRLRLKKEPTNLFNNRHKAWIKIKSSNGNSDLLSYRGEYKCHQQREDAINKQSSTSSPTRSYPATVTIDRTSRGDGLSKYGSDGYIFWVRIPIVVTSCPFLPISPTSRYTTTGFMDHNIFMVNTSVNQVQIQRICPSTTKPITTTLR